MSWLGSKISHSSPTAPPPDSYNVSFENGVGGPNSSSVESPVPTHLRPGIDSLRNRSSLVSATMEPMLGFSDDSERDASKISAYARLDFDNYTFFVQTLQVVLGRKSNDEMHTSHHSVDVHLSSKRAISRRHAKIFYNFGTQRFEISVTGRNGAFVDDLFVEKGMTVPLIDGTKIQIGDIPFCFVLPSIEMHDSDQRKPGATKPLNPSDAINLRTNLYLASSLPIRDKKKSVHILESDRQMARRNSKADIVRRLSTARRKSNASTNEEINALLKELEGLEGDDEDFDPTTLDAEVRELIELNSAKTLTEAEIEKEEEDIDKLVRQHNLQEGVSIEEDAIKEDARSDLDLNMLDQEIASLAPLIDAQSEKLNSDGSRDRDGARNFVSGLPIGGKSAQNSALYYDGSGGSNLNRSSPLMGKPAGPRMGKPATIQPPANKVYGRSTNFGQVGSTYASNYSAGGQGFAYGAGYNGGSPYNPVDTRALPPKLTVVVETITSIPVVNLIVPYKAITSSIDHFEKAPICVWKSVDKPHSLLKIPMRRKDGLARKVSKIQNLKDIPDQFKTKPNISILAMVLNVLRSKSPDKKGLTLSEIHEAIRDLFPYYRYCPDGWQATVTHNVRFNKIFTSIVKTGHESEWLWAIDDVFIAEREKVRKKLQELAAVKAKESALKVAELRQRQRLELPQYSALGKTYLSQDDVPGAGPRSMPSTPGYDSRPKSIAALASEIKRDDSPSLSRTPLYFQRQPAMVSSYSPSPAPSEERQTNIKDQLAANRSRSTSATAFSPPPPKGKIESKESTPQVSGLPSMNQDTKKSLTYLQKELFTLYKARKLSYNTAVTTEIITKALATTIAQVNIIGARAGCGDNALGFLVERAPEQVTKILDIALTKSIKEQQGLLSASTSKESTPQPGGTPGYSANSKLASSPDANQPPSRAVASPSTPTAVHSSKPSPGLSKPPSFGGGPTRPAFSGPSKPQGFSKPGALAKPPQFLSNKRVEKRPNEESEAPNKVIKLE